MKIAVIFLLICSTTLVLAIIAAGDGKIKEAGEGRIPYIALVKVLNPHTGVFEPLCAGAIISETEILTNAVCAAACKATYKCEVYVGRVNVNYGGKKVEIKDTVWHETYVEMDAINFERHCNSIEDIGILFMSKIILSKTVQSIELPQEKMHGRQNKMIIAGWGSGLEHDITHHEKLYFGETLVYAVVWGVDLIRPHDNVNRACISDMGTPLVYPNGTVLAGIGTLWTFRLCTTRDGDMSFYTPIYIHAEWIAKNRKRSV